MAELFGFTIARKKTEAEQETLPSIVSPAQEDGSIEIAQAVPTELMLIWRVKLRTRAISLRNIERCRFNLNVIPLYKIS